MAACMEQNNIPSWNFFQAFHHGIKIDNIGAAAAAGADAFVAGTAIFGADNYTDTISAMRDEIADA